MVVRRYLSRPERWGSGSVTRALSTGNDRPNLGNRIGVPVCEVRAPILAQHRRRIEPGQLFAHPRRRTTFSSRAAGDPAVGAIPIGGLPDPPAAVVPDAERVAGGKAHIANPGGRDHVNTGAAGHVELEDMRPALGLEVEEPNGPARVLGPGIGGGHCPIGAQVERAEGSRRIPAAPGDPAGRGVEGVTPVRAEDTQVGTRSGQ